MTRLEARALSCRRGPALLFRELSFSLQAGEWLAVRGPNGSGKTTLLRCIAGLTRPESGTISREGALLYAGHAPAIKDDFSAEENLRTALGLSGVDVDAARCREALGRVGLERRRALPARRLSAGQRRRIGLARLLLDPSPLWVLDEPLTALDDDGQRLFSEALAGHIGRGGAALLATHHDLAPAPAGVLRIGT